MIKKKGIQNELPDEPNKKSLYEIENLRRRLNRELKNNKPLEHASKVQSFVISEIIENINFIIFSINKKYSYTNFNNSYSKMMNLR